MSIAAGVVTIFFTIYALIKLDYISPSSGSSIRVLQEDTSLYIPQAYLSAIFTFGVILGSCSGGVIADRISRRVCVYFAFFFMSAPLSLLLFSYPSSVWMIYWIFTFAIGAGTGWSFSALTSVISELSKKESMNLTFFTVCISFSNLGSSLGLFIAGQIFNSLAHAGNILLIYHTVFLLFACSSLMGLIPFLMIDHRIYENKSTSINSEKYISLINKEVQ